MIMCSISVLLVPPIPIESAHGLQVAYSHSDISWWMVDINSIVIYIKKHVGCLWHVDHSNSYSIMNEQTLGFTCTSVGHYLKRWWGIYSN